ncbi:MAG: tetratricopeptide repeat protein [Candidatus Rokubacteria bacterium]|nr:tetratricopeptide repeat protein [Candidatus Rokubacteria bacterium]
MLLALAFVLAGCATGTTEISAAQRLQARAAYERAVRSFDERQAMTALTAAQEAVGLDANSAVYRDLLGLVFVELLRPELALEQFQRAMELDPGYADAEFHRGVALAEQRRWEEAVAAYRRAATMPRLTVPHFVQHNLGMAFLNLKRYREAEEALQYALRLEPRLEAAYYHLGLVFAAEGRKEEARAAFRRVGELDPKSPFAQAALERLRDLGDGG